MILVQKAQSARRTSFLAYHVHQYSFVGLLNPVCFSIRLIDDLATFTAGSSLALLLLPIILYINWELVSTKFEHSIPNPFAKFFLLSGYIPDSKPNDPQYQKTWWDSVFLAYYVVFFSFVRQAIFSVSRPIAVYFGIKKRAKIARFGEQAYAFFYFMVFGAWGLVCFVHVVWSSHLTFYSES
jgi:hypothetical protein